MKIAVISDLHLGEGDSVDIFGHDDAEFLRFLDYLEDNFERIVLLGDIYETLTSRNPFKQVEALESAFVAHREITQRFRTDPYRYIHGNHDLVAANVVASPTELELKVDGQRILFCHGHGYDLVGKTSRMVSEWGAWIGGWILRAGLKPVFSALERIDMMLRGARLDPAKCSFQRWAVELARHREADVIVTGHTHMGVVADHGDRLFLNSGSCAEGKYSFLSMDTKKGEYKMNDTW